MKIRMRIVLCFLLAPGLLNTRQAAGQNRDLYVETFDHGPGGWVANRRDPLPVWDGVAYCFGPWFLDPNHAPPGAGYLHMLMFITTTPKWVARLGPHHPSGGSHLKAPWICGRKLPGLRHRTLKSKHGLEALPCFKRALVARRSFGHARENVTAFLRIESVGSDAPAMEFSFALSG